MLTGDNETSAQSVVTKILKNVNQKGRTIEINASMKPHGKLHWVREK